MKKAVALRYKRGEDRAPKVVAKGAGSLAEKIIEIAKKHNIPIEENPSLADALFRLELDQEIPPELYMAVAEVLAFVYSHRKKS